MKKQFFKANKTKLVARVILLVLLFVSALSFAGCGKLQYSWETYSHEEFIKEIEKYNSINNGSIDTFISFNLDSNDDVTQKIYCLQTVVNKTMRQKLGFVDILDEPYSICQVFYLRNEDNSHKYEYKITCRYDRIDNNFTEHDKIEIIKFDNHRCMASDDAYYDESIEDHSDEIVIMYNHYYRCGIYVNGVMIGCIHISSIEETSEEKLDEIIQMMSDSLVVINADGFFIWR